MNFSKVYGKIEEPLLKEAEKLLTRVFIEFGVSYDNKNVKNTTKLGGDPFIFALMSPVKHIATFSVQTAATNGKVFFWNPEFVLKYKRNLVGLRLLCMHEAMHVIYMHPSRRNGRDPRIWNIAIDFIVNFFIFEDLRSRGITNLSEFFKNSFGDYRTLQEYIDFIKQEILDLQAIPEDNQIVPIDFEGELSAEQKSSLDAKAKIVKKFYADPNLPQDMQTPEAIYDYILSFLPKCSECGCIGRVKLKDPPEKPMYCKHKCQECQRNVSIFNYMSTMDEHMDIDILPEEITKRLSTAIDFASKCAGKTPLGLELELKKLTTPVISWKDIIKMKMGKVKELKKRNDWSRFKTRAMCYGVLSPKKTGRSSKFGILIDTSGSVTADKKSKGISQLAALDKENEGVVVCCDTECYWNSATKLKSFDATALNAVKLVGGGGTILSSYFKDYEKYIGKCDFHIVITDGELFEQDITEMKQPIGEVIWLVISESKFDSFKPPFGKKLLLTV